MTDRRIKDLSYGRLGRPVYIAEHGWTFSQDVALEHKIQRLLPITDYLKPSLEKSQEREPAAQSDFKSLTKRYPELHGADEVAKDFARAVPKSDGASDGSLLSVGRGMDAERLTGRKNTFPIFALPSGDAGHLLRVLRPHIERRSWEKHGSVSIPIFIPETAEEALFEVGCGSTIRQILFSNEEDGSGTWLAVRQSTTTSLLRITYSTEDDLTSMSGDISALKHTNLAPSSVVTISVAADEAPHADVAFNPLYNRQIAVVDQSGNWRIWDNVARHGRARLPRLVLGKSGNVLDDFDPNPNLRIPEYSFVDGWHRIFWVCNLTTILVCSRTHLAVFDLKSSSTRLDSTDFMIAKGIEIILDVKRSAKNLTHVFVLTTSRIYWLEIVALVEDRGGTPRLSGVRVVLSYRHFRNENDDSMRLALFKDDFVSALIYSTSNHIVNFYCFSSDENEGSSCNYQSAQGFFNLIANEEGVGENWAKSIRSIYWVPNLFERDSENSHPEELGLKYLKNGLRFFQPLILTTEIGLSSTLCAVAPDTLMHYSTKAPTVRVSKRSYFRGKLPAPEESFIVHDEDQVFQNQVSSLLIRSNLQNSDAFLVNWTHIFEVVFSKPGDTQAMASEKLSTLLAEVASHIEHGLAEDRFIMGTLQELSSFKILSENLDQFGGALDDFFDSLPDDLDSLSDLVVASISNSPGVNLSLDGSLRSADLMKVYQGMVDSWIASLPLAASVAIRGSKFRIIRQIAAEVSLSLVTISIRNKASKARTLTTSKETEDEDDGLPTRESSPSTFYSAQASMGTRQSPEVNFPTPTYTPSTHSHVTTASGVMEDPAISRLRQYAISIRPRPNVGKPKILSEWPTMPGVDPATFVYKKATADSEAEDSENDSALRKKEIARRRKRTERFLQRNTAESSRAVTPAGSQPTELPKAAFSSQPTQDVSMTQPDRGTFGSRKAKAKRKQRTAGF